MKETRAKLWPRLALVALTLTLSVAPPPHGANGQGLSQPLNNATSSLAQSHTVGSGTLVLQSGHGARFGTPSVDRPIRVTVARQSTQVGGQIVPSAARTIFLCTARSGDTLSGLTAVETTSDQAFAKNDPVSANLTAGMIDEIQSAITSVDVDVSTALDAIAGKADDAAVVKLAGNQTITGPINFSTAPVLGSLSGVLKGSSGTLSAAVANTDYVPPNGVGSALTVTPTGATTAATLAASLGNVKDAVNQFGAIGNGTADDTAAIEAAVARAKLEGGGIVHLRAGTYKVRRPIQLASNTTFRGAGRGVTKLTKAATVKSLLTVNCNAGDTTVTVANGALFAVGDAIYLGDTTNWEWLSTPGRITNIAGNVLTFVNTAPGGTVGATASYQTTRGAIVTTSFPLIRNDITSVGIVVRDLTLDGNKGANDPSGSMIDFTLSAIHWEETYRSCVESCEIINSPSDSVSDQANSGRPNASINPGALKATRNRVQNCRIDGAVRHGVHLGSFMDGAFVTNNEITNCGPTLGVGYAVFYCAYATNSLVQGNFVDGCGSGFAGGDDRDSGNSIIGNTVKNWTNYAIEFANAGAGGTTPGRLVIANNIFLATGATSGMVTINQPDCVISGNRFQTAGGFGIVLDTAAVRCTILGNVIVGAQAGGSVGVIVAANDVRMVGNIIKDWASGCQVHIVSRLVATGQVFTGMTSRAWWFTGANTDCVIRNEQNTAATPVSEDVAPVRFIYEGLGDNGTTDPASGGDWNGITGRRWNGTIVHWTSTGTHKFSIFQTASGWQVQN